MHQVEMVDSLHFTILEKIAFKVMHTETLMQSDYLLYLLYI